MTWTLCSQRTFEFTKCHVQSLVSDIFTHNTTYPMQTSPHTYTDMWTYLQATSTGHTYTIYTHTHHRHTHIRHTRKMHIYTHTTHSGTPDHTCTLHLLHIHTSDTHINTHTLLYTFIYRSKINRWEGFSRIFHYSITFSPLYTLKNL